MQLRNVVPKKGCGAIGVIVFNDGFDCGQARCAVKRELRALFEIGNGELHFARRVVCENLQGNGMQKCAFAGVYIADDERIRLFFRKRKRDGLTGDIALADGKENARFAALFLPAFGMRQTGVEGQHGGFFNLRGDGRKRCCAAGREILRRDGKNVFGDVNSAVFCGAARGVLHERGEFLLKTVRQGDRLAHGNEHAHAGVGAHEPDKVFQHLLRDILLHVFDEDVVHRVRRIFCGGATQGLYATGKILCTAPNFRAAARRKRGENVLVRIAAVGGICKVHDGGRIAFKQIERQTAKERVRGGVIR